MKTTLLTTLLILGLGFSNSIFAQDDCPQKNKMKDGSCLTIVYPTAEAAAKAVSAPAEVLVLTESTDGASNGTYIAQFACSETEVIFTKGGPCNCSGYDGTILGTFRFTQADMTCKYDERGVLPVEFSFFKVASDRDMAILSWATASETENDGFYVEKSNDGKFFQEFAFIVGEGNSTEEVNYETTDRDPFSGVNYYRLKQVDYNGSERYSKIVKLDLRDKNGALVNFNANNNELVIRSEKKLVSIEIYDMGGVRVHKSTFDKNANEHTISLSNQNTGHFVAVITDENGSVETSKFVKM
ncbi:T9SS type A sorting domain-containing protein [Portibacter lacus]|uniref:Secretion system C-terminal sorting domain-containing protein n=1 Tax=Portibacter lacus TaxID=1099794 RepID=A0AA37SR17_9BACT|nr:T9SS type A sorting domain-containing protein [Portibacter lacus]GLR18109.1 hypothetical protein GCM10007940_27240 [Portibacter lacus]